MARRRKESGGDLGLLLLALAAVGIVILLAAIYATPMILVVGIIVYEIRTANAPKDFAFSEQELEELSDADRRFNAVRNRLDEIGSEGAHLKQNSDGMYHRGSKLGMTLNIELGALWPLQEELATKYNAILQRPIDDLDNWIGLASTRSAFRWTTLGYLLIGLILYLVDPAWMNSLVYFIRQNTPVAISIAGGSALVSALASAALFPIINFARKDMLNRETNAVRDELRKTPDQEDLQPGLQEDIYQEENDSYELDEIEGAKPWHETLGVSPNASKKEINAAFREQFKRCHPDLVAGLDPDFGTLAEAKAKALNAAREEGLRRATSF